MVCFVNSYPLDSDLSGGYKICFLHLSNNWGLLYIVYRVNVPPDSCIWIYGLLTKCEVKMAGYWPSSFFFACLLTEMESRSINTQKKKIEANIQPS